MINAAPSDIIFVSGGTEANNLTFHSALKHYNECKKIADNKNAKEMMQTAKEHLDEDMITVNDYTAIVNSAKMQAIIDGECNDTEVYRPSSREELLEKKVLLENIDQLFYQG